MNSFEIVVDGPAPAFFHMQTDKELICQGRQWPVLRMYEWQRFSITTGLFIDPGKFVHISECSCLGIEIAKRPTGGGVLFHGAHDLCFSLFFPAHHYIAQASVQESCKLINTAITHMIQSYLLPETLCETPHKQKRCQLCMAQPTEFDILWSGLKIGGCAQRRTKKGVLHQVSLFVHQPDWSIIESIMLDRSLVQVMQTASSCFETCTDGSYTRQQIIESIIKGVSMYETAT